VYYGSEHGKSSIFDKRSSFLNAFSLKSNLFVEQTHVLLKYSPQIENNRRATTFALQTLL